MNSLKKLSALMVAGGLVFALAGVASAEVKWATPDDWYASSGGDGSNDVEFWEERFDLDEGDCAKIEGAALDAVMNDDGSASLGVAYEFVVVKQANPNVKDVTYDNTIFEDVAADETVFADTNGNGVYDEGDSGGISHIIVCNEVEPTEPPATDTPAPPTDTPAPPTDTPPPGEPTPTFFQSQAAETDAPTLPPTSVIDRGTAGPADGAWLLVVALGIFLASVVVLTPARVKNR